MKKIDAYILKKFLTSFLFTISLLTFIAVVIDTSEKADDFVKSGLTTKQIIQQYYFGFVPHIAALLFPLFVFIATIFFTSKMASRSEIIAILASGTSFARMLLPYFVGGVLMATVLWLGNRYVIPRANQLRTSFQRRYVDGNSSYNPADGNNRQRYIRVDTNVYAGVQYYDTMNKQGSNFFLQRMKGNQMVYNLRAENITWDTAKRNWRMDNVLERTINGAFESIISTPIKNIGFNFKPNDLKRDEYTKDILTTPELNTFINSESQRGSEGLNELKIEKYRRDAIPVAVIIFTMIGAIVASKRVRGGSGIHLAVGLLIAVSFEIFNRFSTVFSTKGDFPPLLAAWLPNIVFGLIAIYLYRKAPK
jgi:lipopolysaccharide export system permease protein